MHLDDRRILPAAIKKLIARQLVVPVCIPFLEDLVHSLIKTDCHPKFFSSVRVLAETDLVRSDLFGSYFAFWKLAHLTDHLVEGLDNLEHLVAGDEPIFVDIVHTEDP